MDTIFVEYRKLEDELANPKTAFMRATFHELKIDIEEEMDNNYTDYTPVEVDDLLDGDKERWQIRYSLYEQEFCKSQYLKNPIKCKRRRKIALLPPIESKAANAYGSDTEVSEGYEPDTDEEPSNTEDELITKQLERAIWQSKKSVYVKLYRKTQRNRLKYLAHRIKLRARELLNARQFLMQAEIMISKRSERDKRQLAALRKTYRAHKKRLDYKYLLFAFAYAENVDYADVEKFEETFKYESEYF